MLIESYHNTKKILSDLRNAKKEANKVDFEKLGGFEMMNYLEKKMMM